MLEQTNSESEVATAERAMAALLAEEEAEADARLAAARKVGARTPWPNITPGGWKPFSLEAWGWDPGMSRGAAGKRPWKRKLVGGCAASQRGGGSGSVAGQGQEQGQGQAAVEAAGGCSGRRYGRRRFEGGHEQPGGVRERGW